VSLGEIKTALAELPQDKQDHLAAYLVHLRHRRDDAYRKEITERIDDKNPENWLTLNELKDKWKA
jgi:hypothetical protein